MGVNKNIFCNKCGNKIEKGTKFCVNCGAKITEGKIVHNETIEEGKSIQSMSSEKIYNNNELTEEITEDLEKEITENLEEEKTEENTVDIGDETIDEGIEITEDITTVVNERERDESDYSKPSGSKPSEPKPQRPKSSKSSKSSKMVFGVIIVVAIIAVISFIGIEITKKTVNDPEKLVKKLQVSISEENYNDLAQIVKSSDARLAINEETLKPIVAYFKSNPSQLSDICSELNKMVLVSTENDSRISIEKEEGVSGILGKYKIIVRPVFLKVETKLDNTKILLNGKDFDSIKKGEIKELGPLMPGEYEIFSTYDGEYINLENKMKKDLISNNNEICSLFSNIRSVSIDTEYSKAKVIVNGKNTGKSVEDLSNKLSPVDSETKIQLELDIEGRKFTTSEKLVGEKSNIYFEKIKDVNIYMEKKVILDKFEANIDNEIINLMNEYSRGFESAVNYRNFSYLTKTLYPNSELFKAQQDYINLSATNNVYENFISLSTKNVKYDPATTTGTVDVSEVYETSTKGKTSKDTYYYKYTFKYNETEKRFQLTDMVKQ